MKTAGPISSKLFRSRVTPSDKAQVFGRVKAVDVGNFFFQYKSSWYNFLDTSRVTSLFIEDKNKTFFFLSKSMNLKQLEPVHEISNNVVCATSKASDQPAHTRSLIKAFASRLSIL